MQGDKTMWYIFGLLAFVIISIFVYPKISKLDSIEPQNNKIEVANPDIITNQVNNVEINENYGA